MNCIMQKKIISENFPSTHNLPVFETFSSQKGNVIPVKLDNYNEPGTRVICLNTHCLNGLIQIIPLVGIDVLIGGLFSALITGGILTGLTVYSLSDQIFAVDLAAVDKDVEIRDNLRGYPVVSINDGVVVNVENTLRNDMNESEKMAKKYGNHIVISHEGSAYYSLYAHLEQGSVLVKKGDYVRRGQKIAKVGHSGNSGYNESHLHFEMLYTNVMPKNDFSFKIDLPKMRYGFAPYK